MEELRFGGSAVRGRNANESRPSLSQRKSLRCIRKSSRSPARIRRNGNRYPRTEYDALVGKLAALHKFKREQIVLGCGSVHHKLLVFPRFTLAPASSD